MDHKNEVLQPGYEKVNSPDITDHKERFAESLDRALTSDLEENDDVKAEEKAAKKLNR